MTVIGQSPVGTNGVYVKSHIENSFIKLFHSGMAGSVLVPMIFGLLSI